MRKYIDDIVNGIFEFYGTNDPYVILDDMDVSIKEVPFDYHILKNQNCIFVIELNTIFIRNDLCYNHKLFYLRHELGHILLHLNIFKSGIINKSRCEKQADYFALKLSNITLDEIYMNEMTLEQIASTLELPVRALEQLV